MVAPTREIEMVAVADIHVGHRHRAPTDEAVAQLAASIEQIGLQNPILIRWADELELNGETVFNWPVLVAGAGRLAAIKRLGREHIEAIDVKGDDLDAELIEIDENLCRAELSDVEEAEHLARRKELWELRERNSGNTVSENRGRGRPEGFASETAALTRQTKQIINRRVARAEKIAPDVLDAVRGTKLDKGVALDTLKKLDHEEQRQAVERVQTGASKSIDTPMNSFGERPRTSQRIRALSTCHGMRLIHTWPNGESVTRAVPSQLR